MRLDEFVAAVNKRVAREKIRPADPRARAKVTARTVQFYVAEGLIPSPARHGSRLDYDESHVEAVIQVKRQQAAGKTLDEISAATTKPQSIDFLMDQPLRLRTVDFNRFEARTLNSQTSYKTSTARSTKAIDPSDVQFRWHVDLIDNIEISGSGPLPDRRTIRMIREILQQQGTDMAQEEEE